MMSIIFNMKDDNSTFTYGNETKELTYRPKEHVWIEDYEKIEKIIDYLRNAEPFAYVYAKLLYYSGMLPCEASSLKCSVLSSNSLHIKYNKQSDDFYVFDIPQDLYYELSILGEHYGAEDYLFRPGCYDRSNPRPISLAILNDCISEGGWNISDDLIVSPNTLTYAARVRAFHESGDDYDTGRKLFADVPWLMAKLGLIRRSDLLK